MSLRPLALAALSALALSSLASLQACTAGSTTRIPVDAGPGGAGGTGGGAPDAGPSGWAPGVVRPSVGAGPRGLRDLRGLIHAHTVYSHDACDNQPRDPATDAINEPCLDDFRAGLCRVGHDFAMLTDHNESFGRSEYPDVLIYRPESGDGLLTRGGVPVANRMMCPDGHTPLVLGGTESATIGAGLEGHVPGTVAERQAVYGSDSAEAIQAMRAQGAVSILQHTEDWTVEQISTMPVDGFEMYNLHANFKWGMGAVFALLSTLKNDPDLMPQSDLVLLPVFEEQPTYLSRWAGVLAGGARRVTTMATDCHQNVFHDVLPDGERLDSYRRMMQWFSNHLLVTPDPAGGPVSDTQLKDALRAGRLYGAFEVLGYPRGFDYRAEEGGAVQEMGGEVSIAKGATLRLTTPVVDDLDPTVEAPKVHARILKAEADSWTVVAEGEGDVELTPNQPGAYRAEVRMTPRHLRKYLGAYADQADRDLPWVYGNAIYVLD